MAVWGAPSATEQDGERAARAALELVDAVSQLGREAGVEGLAARAGVVTGAVAVTVGVTGEGMVAGDAVNTAARVQAAAAPGAVLVDEATWRLAQAAIDFSSAGTHMLKGKADPVALWRVERVLSGVGGAQRIDGLEAPFVGRDTELRLVARLARAASLGARATGSACRAEEHSRPSSSEQNGFRSWAGVRKCDPSLPSARLALSPCRRAARPRRIPRRCWRSGYRPTTRRRS